MNYQYDVRFGKMINRYHDFNYKLLEYDYNIQTF